MVTTEQLVVEPQASKDLDDVEDTEAENTEDFSSTDLRTIFRETPGIVRLYIIVLLGFSAIAFGYQAFFTEDQIQASYYEDPAYILNQEYYTVQEGQCLSEIAAILIDRGYFSGKTVGEVVDIIAVTNGIDPNVLGVGQKLIIPES